MQRGEGSTKRSRLVWGTLLGILSVALWGCASGGSSGTRSAGGVDEAAAFGAESPEAAVQGFLAAAKRDDYTAMSHLFGTASGPAERRLGRQRVEQRMFILAAFLEYDRFALRRAGPREGPNRLRLVADMVGTRNGDASVPFLVTSYQGRWYVEQVITDPLTGTTR